MTLRIVSDAFLIFSLFIFPAYISVFLVIFAVFFFDNFVEAIIFGYLLDLLYSSGRIFSVHFEYFFTALLLVIYLFSFKMKPLIRMSL